MKRRKITHSPRSMLLLPSMREVHLTFSAKFALFSFLQGLIMRINYAYKPNIEQHKTINFFTSVGTHSIKTEYRNFSCSNNMSRNLTVMVPFALIENPYGQNQSAKTIEKSKKLRTNREIICNCLAIESCLNSNSELVKNKRNNTC